MTYVGNEHTLLKHLELIRAANVPGAMAVEAVQPETIGRHYNIDDFLIPSGNTSSVFAHNLWTKEKYEKRANMSAVAILFRHPLYESTVNPTIRYMTDDDLTITMACAQYRRKSNNTDDDSDGATHGNTESNGNSGDEEDAAIARYAPTALLVTISLCFFLAS